MAEYRFCPHCGAEIAGERQQLDDADLAIPPASPHTRDDRQQLNLKPPDTPPPASFYRTPSDKNTPVFHSGEKAVPKKDIEEQRPAKNRNLIIVALIVLAIIILLLGGLFTF
ncbi:MAG: hypothetical protein PVH28_02205 [Desulfobacterales bacterium]|jgi:hypothetical protein